MGPPTTPIATSATGPQHRPPISELTLQPTTLLQHTTLQRLDQWVEDKEQQQLVLALFLHWVDSLSNPAEDVPR